MTDVSTTRATLRTELYAVFGNRPRLIKAFENLLLDVAVTLPDQIDDTSDESDAVTQLAVNTAAAAAQADRLRIDALSEGPPPIPMSIDIPDDVAPVIFQLLARVARLESDLANLKDGPTP